MSEQRHVTAEQQATGQLVACKCSVSALKATNIERQEATGVLARAWDGDLASLDSDGEAMAPEDVYLLARAFMLQERLDGHDVNHDRTTDAARLVEVFVNDERVASPLYPAHAAVVTLRYHDEDVWAQVKAGELTGFSFEVSLHVELREVEVLVPADQVRTEEVA